MLFGPNIPDEKLSVHSRSKKSEEKQPSPFKHGFGIDRSVASQEEMRNACTEAFRYRGTITIEAEDGTPHEGCVSNADHSSIELWPKHSARRTLPIESIRSLHFSGKDMAEGRGYQAWIKNWQAKANQSSEGAIA